jgi:hypothetical protein
MVFNGNTPPCQGGVTGSNPVGRLSGTVAQLVERLPEEQGVAGSSPAGSILPEGVV